MRNITDEPLEKTIYQPTDNVTPISEGFPPQGYGEARAAPAPQLKIMKPSDIVLDTKCQHYLVKNVFDRGDLIELYGASGSGKTFAALDLSRHIAAGADYLDQRVKKGRVLYFTLEGHRGFQKRVKAIEQEHGFPENDPFQFACIKGGDFDHPEFHASALDTIKQERFDLVVVDTLARFLNEADENTGPGMAKAISFADEVSARTEAAVLFVHHSGKEAARGARGHSSLKAAADCEMHVEKSEDGGRCLTLSKVKDGEDGKSFSFALERVVLGIDDEGDEISTCIITEMNAAATGKGKQKRQKPTADQTKFWQLVKDVIDRKGETVKVESDMPAAKAILRSQLHPHLKDEGFFGETEAGNLAGNSDPSQKKALKSERNKIQTLLNGLHGRELLNFNGKYVWLVADDDE